MEHYLGKEVVLYDTNYCSVVAYPSPSLNQDIFIVEFRTKSNILQGHYIYNATNHAQTVIREGYYRFEYPTGGDQHFEDEEAIIAIATEVSDIIEEYVKRIDKINDFIRTYIQPRFIK